MSLLAFQNRTSVTSITSPPPCRKYTTLPRSSSCNVLADIAGSGGDIPQSVRRLQHEILVDTRQVHHSTSQPNGFNYGQEMPIEISSLQLPKKSVCLLLAIHSGCSLLCIVYGCVQHSIVFYKQYTLLFWTVF